MPQAVGIVHPWYLSLLSCVRLSFPICEVEIMGTHFLMLSQET